MIYKPTNIGVVAIGRNEGDRLKRCLHSIIQQTDWIIYVDSGSTDDSPQLARSLGIETVELDFSVPFTAARARNAGFEKLLEIYPDIEFVQFIDGDCELAESWLSQAIEAFQPQPQLGVICGRRREQFPHASIYNLLCELEWDIPSGEVKSSMGDALMRVTAFAEVNGYNPSLIAGEDPELGIRLRQQGWKILRLSADMTYHDAQITRFSQWWKRSVRGGYAYAEGASMYGNTPEKHWVKESRRVWLWGLCLPLLFLVGIGCIGRWSFLLLIGYIIQLAKIFRFYQSYSWNLRDNLLYSGFCVLAKFPELLGQIKFHRNRLLKQQSVLIEYKNSTSA
ncbi:MAG: glycosyltransferase family A protein [Microcoleaceae cyanobacterium MO_207.B10]|nr:glycosyltransferase family A protein [Microcoleaceae cyanobacterium MO_207.B10]